MTEIQTRTASLITAKKNLSEAPVADMLKDSVLRDLEMWRLNEAEPNTRWVDDEVEWTEDEVEEPVFDQDGEPTEETVAYYRLTGARRYVVDEMPPSGPEPE